ncbi:hypothetical protein IT397_02975 [Candidatus Nomurabacteria bacterium]|nr:hypothetical protein [Candidatus Nomurabacteria bacterium]
MYSWANRRKIIYLTIIALVILIPLGIILFNVFYEKPTCFDGKRNQDEGGVDCGGVCSRVCPTNSSKPLVVWQRIFRIAPGVYNAAAYIQNPNVGAGAENVNYSVKVFDSEKRDLIIFERTGTTKIYPRSNFPIVETSITTGERTPGRIVFEFPENINWIKTQDDEKNISITSKVLSNEDVSPRINVSLSNESIKSYSSFEVVAIVYDSSDNAVGVSKTIVDSLPKNSKTNIVFTWPQPFSSKASRIEIVPKF